MMYKLNFLLYPVIILSVLLELTLSFNYNSGSGCIPQTFVGVKKTKYCGVRDLQCKIIQIPRMEMLNLVPQRVRNDQWASYWGMNSMEKLQQIVGSVAFAYGGAWLAWFTSFMAGPLVASMIGTATVFNWIYNPWIHAQRRNSKVWPQSRLLFYATFSCRISSLKMVARRAGKSVGAVSQKYLGVVLEDELGRRLDIVTQWQESYSQLREGMLCETVLCSATKDFTDLVLVTDIWVPSCDTWIGDYPYLVKENFRMLIKKLLSKFPDRIMPLTDTTTTTTTNDNNGNDEDYYEEVSTDFIPEETEGEEYEDFEYEENMVFKNRGERERDQEEDQVYGDMIQQQETNFLNSDFQWKRNRATRSR